MNIKGDTPLHLSARHGHTKVTQLLLQQHADPTVQNNDGNILHYR